MTAEALVERAGRLARRSADLRAERDAAIRAALEAGASLRQVATATGLSHRAVALIRDRAAPG